MYTSRSKVSAPVSRSVSSYTPGSKVDVDYKKAEQIKKETGSTKDIEENGKDAKWLSGFMDAFATADKSEPPRPKVVTLPSSVIP